MTIPKFFRGYWLFGRVDSLIAAHTATLGLFPSGAIRCEEEAAFWFSVALAKPSGPKERYTPAHTLDSREYMLRTASV